MRMRSVTTRFGTVMALCIGSVVGTSGDGTGAQPEVRILRTPILIQSGSAEIVMENELTCPANQTEPCNLGDARPAFMDVVTHRGGKMQVQLDTRDPGERTLEIWFKGGGDPQKKERPADLRVSADGSAWTLLRGKGVSCGQGQPEQWGQRHACRDENKTPVGHYRLNGGAITQVQHVACILRGHDPAAR